MYLVDVTSTNASLSVCAVSAESSSNDSVRRKALLPSDIEPPIKKIKIKRL